MRLLPTLLIAFLASTSLEAQKREQFHNADAMYSSVSDQQGNQLRTLVTKPKATLAKVPAIFFVGWLSCDSVEYPNGETDGFGAIF